jgi:hypothetical protein
MVMTAISARVAYKLDKFGRKFGHAGLGSALRRLTSEFKSTEQTGTGSAQNVAHGLGATPSLVLVIPTKVNAVGDTFVEGTHDATNVKVTATAGAKYIVYARL